jgi:hypothetical protein
LTITPKRKLAPIFNRMTGRMYRPLEHNGANIIWIPRA